MIHELMDINRNVDEIIDPDNFVIGNRDEQKAQPLDCSLPKVLVYMKKSGKRFDKLTDEERTMCK